MQMSENANAKKVTVVLNKGSCCHDLVTVCFFWARKDNNHLIVQRSSSICLLTSKRLVSWVGTIWWPSTIRPCNLVSISIFSLITSISLHLFELINHPNKFNEELVKSYNDPHSTIASLIWADVSATCFLLLLLESQGNLLFSLHNLFFEEVIPPTYPSQLH